MNTKVKLQAELGGAEEAAEEVAADVETVEAGDDLDLAIKNEWAELMAEEEDSEGAPVSEAEEEPAVQEEVAEEAAVEEGEVEAKTPTTVEEVVTEEVLEEKDTVVVPPAEVPAQPTQTSEEVQTAVKQARETARVKLAEQFKLTDEQADELIRDPNAVLPDLVANVYLDLFDSMMMGMRSQMPAMIHGVIQQQQVKETAEKAFYGAWPQLAKTEYRATIDRIAASYQQQNPGVDQQTAIKEIGAQAWVALRLPLDGLLKHTGGAGEAAETLGGARTPAGPGNAPVVAPQRQSNPYADLADEFIEDDY